MSPLAHVLQVAIVGGALVGVLVLLGGTATVDYLKARAAAIDAAADGRHEPDEPGPCAWHWTADGSPCGCDPDDEVDPDDDEVNPDDPGAEWDRARDRDLDYRAGVA